MLPLARIYNPGIISEENSDGENKEDKDDEQADGDDLPAKEKFNKGFDKAYYYAYNNAFVIGSHDGFVRLTFHYPLSSSFPVSLRRAFWRLSSYDPFLAGHNAGLIDGNYFGYVHGYEWGNNQRKEFIKNKRFAPWDSDVPAGKYDPVSPLLPEWYKYYKQLKF